MVYTLHHNCTVIQVIPTLMHLVILIYLSVLCRALFSTIDTIIGDSLMFLAYIQHMLISGKKKTKWNVEEKSAMNHK
jgi:hypothetical protein